MESVFQLLKGMGLALECGWMNLVNTPLWKADVSFSQRCQLQIASQLEVELCAHFFSVLEKKKVWFDLMCHVTVSVSSYVYKSCCVWKTLLCLEGNFLGVTHHL